MVTTITTPTVTAPSTATVDKNYFKNPDETSQAYSARIASYNTSKTPAPTPTNTPPAGWDATSYTNFKTANPGLEPTAQDTAKMQSANTAQANGGTYRGSDGQLYYNSNNQPATSSSSTADFTMPTPTGDSTTDLNTAQNASAHITDQMNAAAQTFATTVTNIQNGTVPLSAGEQAQVDALKQQYQTLIDSTTLNNKGAVGGATVNSFASGAYSPLFQANTINQIAAKGQQNVADLQTKQAAAVAQLTQSLKDNDIQAVKTAYDAFTSAQKDTQTALQKTISDTQTAITTATNYALDVAKFNQTGDQQAFDNALKTEQNQFAEQNKNANLALDQFKAGLGAGGGSNGVTQAAQITPSGNPDPVSQKAVLDQITQQYGPITAQAIQGLADYSINPTDWSSRAGAKGLSRADAVSLAQMYDPTYNDTSYAIRAAYLKSISSTQTGTVGSAVNSANKAINHLTAFVTDISKLPNGPSSKINAFDNALTMNQGVRQNIGAAQTEGLGVAEELAKFFKGSGTVDVASIDAWKSQLNTNASPADVKGLTQGAITLLAGQLETLTEQYKSTMGKEPETDFLNTSARASLSSLKNQGYEVNIPGINYTDKNAYLKYDPEAQGNMSTAVDRLTKSGLPITPENILQMAQSLDSTPEPTQSFNSVGGDTKQASNIQLGSPLAIANNNPFNLRYAGQNGATQGKSGFASFPTPEAGVQAGYNQIKLDASRGLTLAQFISKYAPPSENDTQQYIKQISAATSASPTTKLSDIPISTLAKAIAHKESGTIIS